jgi:hypothetical protein
MHLSRRSPSSFWLLTSFVIFTLVFSLSFARAQVVGASISGTVRDASGAAVVGLMSRSRMKRRAPFAIW